MVINFFLILGYNKCVEILNSIVKCKSFRKKFLLDLCINRIRNGNTEQEWNKSLKLFSQNFPNDPDINKIKEIVDKKMNISSGKIAPNFKLKDISGKVVELVDFKGKIVYIDFWATWCSPCRNELPFLDKIFDEYNPKGVEFISISLDSDITAWNSFVNDKKLKGIQLNDANKIASTDYSIQGIPCFILIDKAGKIFQYDAARPSQPELKKLFEQLGVK